MEANGLIFQPVFFILYESGSLGYGATNGNGYTKFIVDCKIK